jgi:hypothetical protein
MVRAPGNPVISSDGADNGVVWEIRAPGLRANTYHAELLALDALTLEQIYDSATAAHQGDAAGIRTKFAVPLVVSRIPGRVDLVAWCMDHSYNDGFFRAFQWATQLLVVRRADW